jgi:hypothetical protein
VWPSNTSHSQASKTPPSRLVLRELSLMHALRASNYVFSFDLLGMAVEWTLPSRDMMIIKCTTIIINSLRYNECVPALHNSRRACPAAFRYSLLKDLRCYNLGIKLCFRLILDVAYDAFWTSLLVPLARRLPFAGPIESR